MILIREASEVFLPDGVATHASVLIEDGRIRDIGRQVTARGAEVIDARGKTLLPGWVDSHTHVVFAGSREFELDLKLQGATYREIAARGGGIGYTVQQTRRVSEERLQAETEPRLNAMLAHGTTTAEVKSGYGLDTKSEVKMLRTVRHLNERHPVDLVPTFMGAHAIPPGVDREDYVRLVREEMIPRVAEEQLAVFCDVFCEEGYFSVEESRAILQAGLEHGLTPRVHADELSDSGGAELAAELKAASADHLLMASPRGLKKMARAGVPAVLLPAVPFSLMQKRYAPARRMLELGLDVALATDLNPNCWTENMQFVIQLACFVMGMTPREAIHGATLEGARVLGLEREVGSIEVGKKADLLLVNAPSHLFVPYHFGVNLVETVIKDGVVVCGG
ncbi:MAG: imidazolonepropionase [Candidatus Thermoplasmatota archaeon]|nr:imidazolonepropionase [Candidatus Thermoplasmatota archaeon]